MKMTGSTCTVVTCLGEKLLQTWSTVSSEIINVNVKPTIMHLNHGRFCALETSERLVSL